MKLPKEGHHVLFDVRTIIGHRGGYCRAGEIALAILWLWQYLQKYNVREISIRFFHILAAPG